MSYYCPSCNGVIYNRRNKMCGFCGAALPPELLFTASELEILNQEEAAADARYKEQRAREQAEAEAEARAREPYIFIPPFSG
jgi:hypothetical protein